MKGQKGFLLVAKLPSHGFSLKASFASILKQILRWHDLHRERAQLMQLSDAALKDMGLSRADIFEESERPFWDDPLKR
ncbi:DUF1127 domain-containing protein [Pseudomonas akapageensis]|uniref:DUF1127 domain-containing protein n=1 Tax=Pseudomonas akapageensis TaxID=2609961 RepID=UPI00140995A7|nr:DUF1127 domain-containing protein [Pseudomonas akapageensis]